MKLNNYIKKHWNNLPKSKFDDLEVVVFHEVRNNDEGWGHHSYEGYAVDKEGRYQWVFSSGCSCQGGPSSEEIKTFTISQADVVKKKLSEIDFNALQVEFESY